jgi:hypothetical protein
MDAIRPTQFSALKVLDPLDDEEEHGENDDRYADDQKVVHGFSQDLNTSGRIPNGLIKDLVRARNCDLHSPHADARGFLTDSMHGRLYQAGMPLSGP